MLPFIAQRRQPIIRAIVFERGRLCMQTLNEGVVAAPVKRSVLRLLLLPLVAAILISVLLRAGNRRNLPLGAILLLLTVANAAFPAAPCGL